LATKPVPAATRRVALALTTALLALGAVLTATPADANTAEHHLLARVNHARTAHGRPTLARRADLAEVARAQARRMAASRTLYHNPNLTTEVRNWRWVGENVGYAPDIATVHAAFMASPHHRANILDRDYTQVGVGVVTRHGRVWVAEVFRRPLRAAFQSDATTNAAGVRATLRYGATGPAVQRVQARLLLPRTGFYGTATQDAVRQFQRAQGWAGHGNVGPLTWSRMF
jgi:hypothetical protein